MLPKFRLLPKTSMISIFDQKSGKMSTKNLKKNRNVFGFSIVFSRPGIFFEILTKNGKT